MKNDMVYEESIKGLKTIKEQLECRLRALDCTITTIEKLVGIEGISEEQLHRSVAQAIARYTRFILETEGSYFKVDDNERKIWDTILNIK